MPTKITRYRLSGTTDASGAATVQGTKVVRGRIIAIIGNTEPLADTADITITTTDEAATQTILSLTNVSGDVVVYPRTAVQDNTDTDVTYDGTNEIYEPYVVFSRLKCVVAQGGDSKSFKIDILVEEF